MEVFEPVDCGLELVVIDDDSPDGTAEAVTGAFADDERVHLIVRTVNRGLAYSIRDGIERAAGEYLVVMDTDFNHSPEDALAMFNICHHTDIVVGSRFIYGGGMPDPTRYCLSYLFNIFTRLLLGSRIDDNLSGFFAIRREALECLDYDKVFWGYGDYFIRFLLMSQSHKLRHVQFPVYYGLRQNDPQKTNVLQIGIKYTKEVIKLWFLRLVNRW